GIARRARRETVSLGVATALVLAFGFSVGHAPSLKNGITAYAWAAWLASALRMKESRKPEYATH
ncbi:MAG: hypothetical protein WBF47_18030, partial [Xanthobacteraceae bacterium]